MSSPQRGPNALPGENQESQRQSPKAGAPLPQEASKHWGRPAQPSQSHCPGPCQACVLSAKSLQAPTHDTSPRGANSTSS